VFLRRKVELWIARKYTARGNDYSKELDLFELNSDHGLAAGSGVQVPAKAFQSSNPSILLYSPEY
jgi:hypothetical protein